VSVTIGSKLGVYEVGAGIPAGGMGEVYRARDARLKRGLIHYQFLSQHDKILHKLHGHPRYEKLMEEVKYAWEHLEG
jgi:hypothetical protein